MNQLRNISLRGVLAAVPVGIGGALGSGDFKGLAACANRLNPNEEITKGACHGF